ncbi:unnamed protein product [Trichogramma brassicae]|uniref:Uncharacterized protein n=1 Tax=Trichogramma brassicae TaxID=86971 RepID=A0A6H5I262_9HYME|nr:unnamed protein product [Trichogramma brassicae]
MARQRAVCARRALETRRYTLYEARPSTQQLPVLRAERRVCESELPYSAMHSRTRPVSRVGRDTRVYIHHTLYTRLYNINIISSRSSYAYKRCSRRGRDTTSVGASELQVRCGGELPTRYDELFGSRVLQHCLLPSSVVAPVRACALTGQRVQAQQRQRVIRLKSCRTFKIVLHCARAVCAAQGNSCSSCTCVGPGRAPIYEAQFLPSYSPAKEQKVTATLSVERAIVAALLVASNDESFFADTAGQKTMKEELDDTRHGGEYYNFDSVVFREGKNFETFPFYKSSYIVYPTIKRHYFAIISRPGSTIKVSDDSKLAAAAAATSACSCTLYIGTVATLQRRRICSINYELIHRRTHARAICDNTPSCLYEKYESGVHAHVSKGLPHYFILFDTIKYYNYVFFIKMTSHNIKRTRVAQKLPLRERMSQWWSKFKTDAKESANEIREKIVHFWNRVTGKEAEIAKEQLQELENRVKEIDQTYQTQLSTKVAEIENLKKVVAEREADAEKQSELEASLQAQIQELKKLREGAEDRLTEVNQLYHKLLANLKKKSEKKEEKEKIKDSERERKVKEERARRAEERRQKEERRLRHEERHQYRLYH